MYSCFKAVSGILTPNLSLYIIESVGKATRHEATLDMWSGAAGSYVVQAEAEGQVFAEKLVEQ